MSSRWTAGASPATAQTPNEWAMAASTASPFAFVLATARRSTRCGLLYRPLRADRPCVGRPDLTPNRPIRVKPAPVPAKRAHGLAKERHER